MDDRSDAPKPLPRQVAGLDVGPAISSLRTTATWLVTAFAAIGAALTAGTQLSSLGRLGASDARLWLSLAAATIALLSVGFALGAAILVLTSRYVSFSEMLHDGASQPMRDDLAEARRVEILRYPTVEDLHAARERLKYARQALAERARTDYENRANQPDWDSPAREEVRKGWRREHQRLSKELTNLQQGLNELLLFVSYLRVRRRFTTAVRALYYYGFLAALFIGLFTWAANPPAAATPFAVPASASIQLSDAGQSLLQTSLGRNCDVAKPLSAVLLAETDQYYDVVTSRSNTCNATRVSMDRSGDLGAVLPDQAVKAGQPGSADTPTLLKDAGLPGLLTLVVGIILVTLGLPITGLRDQRRTSVPIAVRPNRPRAEDQCPRTQAVEFSWQGFAGAHNYILHIWLAQRASQAQLSANDMVSYSTLVHDALTYRWNAATFVPGTYRYEIVPLDANGRALAGPSRAAAFSLTAP